MDIILGANMLYMVPKGLKSIIHCVAHVDTLTTNAIALL